MREHDELSRRGFLRLSAVAAGSALVAACGGGGSDPTPQAQGTAPGGAQVPTGAPAEPAPTVARGSVRTTEVVAATSEYAEAPALAAMVQAKKLPPVAERLPKKPYVVPHKWVKPGKYGGTMRMIADEGWGVNHFVQESMYGHSPLRWLKDGLELGPGLVQDWSPNEDASEWTFKFREGLKWSDGKPWTTADIMYWWDDMVVNDDHPAVSPEDFRSGKGTLAKLAAPDDLTIKVTFDSPAPFLADYMACWVKRGIGPDYMQPRHYMEQFHQKYNKKVKKDWVETHEQMRDFAQNNKCPTMTGWMLKSYKEGVNSVWERNPYYWCVDKQGNQLPYIDGIYVEGVQNPEVRKLRILDGKIDYVHGPFIALALSDVADIKRAQNRHKMETIFWDTGSGTGSIFFFNFDYDEPKIRAIVRNPKFRKALSHAYNREEVRKVVFFGQGQPTTGTMSPKAIEYVADAEGKQLYERWRTSALKYDPAMAKRMLDELNLKDRDGDGFREMPDGSKLVIRVEMPADRKGDVLQKNQLLVKHWRAVGIDARINPVAPTGYFELFHQGKVMSETTGDSPDGPNQLLWANWMVPIDPDRFGAPLHSVWYREFKGTPRADAQKNVDPWKRRPKRIMPSDKEAFFEPVGRLWKLYEQAKIEPDFAKRTRLVHAINKIHIEDGPFIMGTVANPPSLVLVKQGLMNVPRRNELAQKGWTSPWIHPSPAVYDPEAYYWDDPAAHT